MKFDIAISQVKGDYRYYIKIEVDEEMDLNNFGKVMFVIRLETKKGIVIKNFIN
jgi:hypothetical protein